jgi:SAM-dependent methyltransferase
MTAADPYAESGEFIDVLSQDAWQALRAPISQALRQAAPQQGPIVDIGAGTGLGTLLVAETVPAADIIAVEPSPILRAVLLARLVTNEHLRQRVTVHATDAETMRLPARLGGVLAINMIGHLPPQRRRQLWADLRPRLAPAAPLIVNLQLPAEPTTVPETTFASVRIGDRIYQGSGGAEPAGDDSVTWTMRYRTIDPAGAVDNELVVDYQWQVVSPQTLLDELTAAGYTATVREPDLVVATPR